MGNIKEHLLDNINLILNDPDTSNQPEVRQILYTYTQDDSIDKLYEKLNNLGKTNKFIHTNHIMQKITTAISSNSELRYNLDTLTISLTPELNSNNKTLIHKLLTEVLYEFPIARQYQTTY